VAALTFFVANTLLTSAIIAYVLGLPIGLVWWRGHRHILLPNLGLHAIGVPIAGLWLAYPWMLVCVGIALLALRRAIDDRSSSRRRRWTVCSSWRTSLMRATSTRTGTPSASGTTPSSWPSNWTLP